MFLNQDTQDLQVLSKQLSRAAHMPVSVVASTDSTNQQLLGDPDSVPIDPQAPCALLALHQTAGRGRMGRAWTTSDAADHNAKAQHSAPAFLGSMAIRTSLPVSQLSLLPLHMGVALAQQLQQWGCPARVKWPNDLEVDGAKLGGILLESRAVNGLGLVVMGLGINWTQAPVIEGRPTTNVSSHSSALPAPIEAAAAILRAMHAAWERTVSGAPIEFAPFDALFGHSVSTQRGDSPAHPVHGIAMGINQAGHLGIRTAHGTHWVSSGEVSIARL